MGNHMRAFVLLCVAAVLAHATTFYVTVAGLGGEEEYQQRFETVGERDRQAPEGEPGFDVRYHLRRNCHEGEVQSALQFGRDESANQ